MALKGKDWFLGKCLMQERKRTKLTYLSAKALGLGFGRDRTQGHISQACGAAQRFLMEYPNHKRTIKGESPTEPYKLVGRIRRDWLVFLSDKSGFNSRRFNYNWDTFKLCVTRKYGGSRSGGGGGDNELEIVLRLMAEFI